MVFFSAERLLLCCSRSPQAPTEDLPAMLPVSSAKPYEPHAPAAGLGDEAGWQQVGSGHRYGRAIPPSSSRVEALERSLSFKLWARGRCFRCLECGTKLAPVRSPSIASFSIVRVTGSITAVVDLQSAALLHHEVAAHLLVLLALHSLGPEQRLCAILCHLPQFCHHPLPELVGMALSALFQTLTCRPISLLCAPSYFSLLRIASKR
jgi:hypothetical protein